MDVQETLLRDNSALSNTVAKLNRDVAKVPEHYCLFASHFGKNLTDFYVLHY